VKLTENPDSQFDCSIPDTYLTAHRVDVGSRALTLAPLANNLLRCTKSPLCAAACKPVQRAASAALGATWAWAGPARAATARSAIIKVFCIALHFRRMRLPRVRCRCIVEKLTLLQSQLTAAIYAFCVMVRPTGGLILFVCSAWNFTSRKPTE
jgi:hypothetical protein